MKELLEFIARSLVEDVASVQVIERVMGSRVDLELVVAEEDMGRIIGRGGSIAGAIRSLLRVAAAHEGMHVNLDIGPSQ